MSSSRKYLRQQGNKEHPLQVQYHPGLGSGGTDEILRPLLMSVGDQGSCYRIVKDSFGRRESDQEHSGVINPVDGEESVDHHVYNDTQFPAFQDDVYDEGQDTTMELEGLEQIPANAGGGFSLSLAVPQIFFKFIIGAKGATRANIEQETKCLLRIPRRGQDGNLVIEGATSAIVSHAKQRVDMVVWTSRFKEDPNYFISVPLNTPELKEELERFVKEVLETCGQDRGVVPGVFQVPDRFHLTLGMLRIFSKEEEEKAIRVLEQSILEAKEEIKESNPMTILLQGLDTMNDDMSAIRVLYSKVKTSDSTHRLQDFVDGIISSFTRGAPELIKKEFGREKVKLHATVMNCSFLDSCAAELEVHRGQRRIRSKETIEATQVFKHFNDFNFGELILNTIHLSKRFERDPDGYYKCLHKCSF